jgi:hypothetical protein
VEKKVKRRKKIKETEERCELFDQQGKSRRAIKHLLID